MVACTRLALAQGIAANKAVDGTLMTRMPFGIGCACVALALASCASAPKRTLSKILPSYVALPNGRDPFKPDQYPPSLAATDAAGGEGVIRFYEQKMGRPLNILELSGGGQNGAFGAGVLKGWRESGTRPSFDLVTGVSTGALLATHAFLGTPEDDAVLEEIFTGVTQKDIYQKVGMLSVLFGASSLLDSDPLGKLIDRYVTPDVITRMAKAHDEHRRLWVATTNLDYNQTWVWNMTLIAKLGGKDVLETYRKVVRASASFPIAFQPVEIDGHLFADGATRINLLVVDKSGRGRPKPPLYGPGNVYVIHNGRSKDKPEAVSADVEDLAGAAIGVMMASSMNFVMLHAYLATTVQGYHFHTLAIPDDVDVGSNALAFDPQQMRAGFDAGYALGKQEHPWKSAPPHTQDFPDWMFDVR